MKQPHCLSFFCFIYKVIYLIHPSFHPSIHPSVHPSISGSELNNKVIVAMIPPSLKSQKVSSHQKRLEVNRLIASRADIISCRLHRKTPPQKKTTTTLQQQMLEIGVHEIISKLLFSEG